MKKLTLTERMSIENILETVLENLTYERGLGYCSDMDLILCLEQTDFKAAKRALKKIQEG